MRVFEMSERLVLAGERPLAAAEISASIGSDLKSTATGGGVPFIVAGDIRNIV